MKQNLRVSLGAVILALATLAAVIFAYINFEQRSRFELLDDGVAWLDTDARRGGLEGKSEFAGRRGRVFGRATVWWRSTARR